MSFGEYFNAFGSLGDTVVAAREHADQRRYAEEAAALAGKQLDAYLAQSAGLPGGVGQMSGSGPSQGGLSALGTPSTPRLPTFTDASGAGGSYIANLFKRESGGNPNAQAKTSSAKGLGQFTDGTWAGVMRQHPELGLTPNGRTDPNQMLKATQAFTADNEKILANAGLPVNDATRYSLHFLGSGGGPKFVAGALSNPDAPAASFVQPAQANANRTIFFNRDGSPKSAGTVLNSFARSFGGGSPQVAQASIAVPVVNAPQMADAGLRPAMQMPGVISSPPLPPQRPIQVASADPNNLPLPANAAADYESPSGPSDGTAPAITQPSMRAPSGPAMTMPGLPAQPVAQPQQAGGANPADIPAPNAQPAEFRIPPGPQAQVAPQQAAPSDFVPGTVASPAIQGGRQQDLPAVAGAPRFSPQQAAYLRAQLANPLTRAQAIQTIQGLGAPDKWETKELGGRVVQVNGRGDIRPVPGFDKPTQLQTVTGPDGNLYTFNPQTGEARRAIEGREKSFTDLITPEQRAAAGIPANYTGPAQRGPNGELRLPGKATTEVNIDQKGETAFSTTANTAIAKRFEKLSEEGDGARADTALLGQLDALGSVVGTGPLAAAQAYLADKGIKLGDNVGAVEAYGAIVDKMVPAQRIPGSGTTSDFDAKGFKSSLPNLMKTPEGNALIIGTLKALNDDKIARARIAERALTGEIKPQDAVRELRALPPPNIAFKSGLAELAKAGKLSGQGATQSSQPSQGAVAAPPRPSQQPILAPPPSAVDYLRANPGLRDSFDAKYGRGAADQILGGGRSGGGVL